jgi:hypothetical protein
MSAPEDHYEPEPVETWVLRTRDTILARKRTWGECVHEADIRGLLRMDSCASFTLHPWHYIEKG